MDAQSCQPADMRSRRNTRMCVERPCPTPLDSAGLGLIVAATSFSVQCVAAAVSFHRNLLSLAWSPFLKKHRTAERS